MEIQAFIRYSDFDISESVTDLRNHLAGLGIKAINDDSALSPDTFYIYFRNPYIRYPRLKEFINHIKEVSDFPCAFSGRELIGLSLKYKNEAGFYLNDFPVKIEKPVKESIPIVLYTHKRLDYLRLSLNSLLYSLWYDDLSNLTIFMSDPTPDLESYVLEVSQKYPSISVYKSLNNVGVAALNMYLQIVRPERFVIFEEDFILPQYVRHILPYWNRQFNYLLDTYDTVNFQTSIENQCFDLFISRTETVKRPTVFSYSPAWETNKSTESHITGNGFAVKTKFYASCGVDNPPHYLRGDGYVLSKAEKICVSGIHGYHIGWNQEMDGYPRIGDWSRFPTPDQIQKAVNCRTGQEYTVNLEKLRDLC